MEFLEADLKKILKSSLTLTEKHIQFIMYNMLKNIKYLHTAEVMHRDVKPSNVLIDEDCQTKLCDFGLSRSFSGVNTVPLQFLHNIKKMVQEENGKRQLQGLQHMTY